MGIPALPFSAQAESVRKPYGSEYILNPQTLGEKIRNRRIELGLFQREVAEQIGVTEDSVTFWENGTASPLVKQYPQIITLLGYFPFDIDVSTLGGRITRYRYTEGLTPKEFGELVEVNASTVRAWEEGKHVPSKLVQSKVGNIVDSGQAVNRFDTRLKVN